MFNFNVLTNWIKGEQLPEVAEAIFVAQAEAAMPNLTTEAYPKTTTTNDPYPDPWEFL